MSFFNFFKSNKEVKTEIDIDIILKGLNVMAILDIILDPKKDYQRYVGYSHEDDLKTYNLDTGGGDTLNVYILDNYILIKGFDHESELNQFSKDEWDKNFFDYIYSGFPNDLRKLLSEDDVDYTTFAMWYNPKQNCWNQNKWQENDGGEKFLLSLIRKNAIEWCDWAKYYYSREFDINIIKKIYETQTVTDEQIQKINPETDSIIIINKLKEKGLL